MTVTSYTGKRQSKGRRAHSERSFPLTPVLIGVGGALAVLLFASAALRSHASQSALAKHYGPQVTSASFFAPTRQGAIAAATAFEQYYLIADLQDEVTARQKVMARTDQTFQKQMKAMLDDLFLNAADNPLVKAKATGAQYVAKTWPISFVVNAYAPNRAVVSIWSSTLAGVLSEAVPRVGYTRDRITINRVDDRWLVSNYETLPPIVPYSSAMDSTTKEKTFYKYQKGAQFYDFAL